MRKESMDVKTKSSSIEIDSNDDKTRVLFTPDDKDRFVLSCRDTVRFAQLGQNIDAVGDELRALFTHVSEWCSAREEAIGSCYIVPRDGVLAIVMVPSSGVFDLKLSDAITELDIVIAQKFQIFACEVCQYPARSNEELACFIDLENAQKIHGGSRPQEKVAPG